MTEPVLVTMAEAARLLSTSTRTLHRWSAANIIGMRKIRGRWFVPVSEIRCMALVTVGHGGTPRRTDKIKNCRRLRQLLDGLSVTRGSSNREKA